MKKFLVILLSIVLTFGLVGCNSAAKKERKAIVVGVYSVHKSLEKGRFDLAKVYSSELVRIIPPPKNLPVIEEFKTKSGGRSVVLPSQENGSKVYSNGSEDFKAALAEDPELRARIEKETKDAEAFKKTIDDAIRSEHAELVKSREDSGSWGWFSFLGIGGIVGVIALCVFFPALMPIVINIFSSVVSGINNMLSAISNWWKKK